MKIKIISEPFEFFKSNDLFKLFLHFMLRVANYLNHGSNKANAQGFTFDSLSAFENVKS